MPDEKLPLVLHPSSSLVLLKPQGGRIVAEMMSGALALSRTAEVASSALTSRFKIGSLELCGPDYQQILLWAKALKLEPETVIEQLLTGSERWQEHKTQFVNGRIIQLCWEIDLWPLRFFEWVDGLIIEEITLTLEGREIADMGDCVFDMLVERILSLPLLKLRRLNCGSIGLGSLDLSLVPQLVELNCEGNLIESLDLSAVPLLTELDFSGSPLSSLELTGAPLLTKINCYNCKLTSLDLSAVTQLEKLWCGWNQLTSLDLSTVAFLNELDCVYNQLTSLKLSSVPLLTKLECSDNQISALDLSAVPQLAKLNCDCNIISSLNLSNVPHLRELDCAGNYLTFLDLSATPLLTMLKCQRNRIVTLDIRPLKELKSLIYDWKETRLIQRPDQNF